jgi:site-specific recombinase XerD
MTEKLKATLESFRHLRCQRVLYRDDRTPMSEQTLRSWVAAAQRKANLRANGGKHILRHTFCSHLAMRGATVIAIKELAGHRSLRTTMWYMHLSPSHMGEAIKLLDAARTQAPQAQGTTTPTSAARYGNLTATEAVESKTAETSAG